MYGIMAYFVAEFIVLLIGFIIGYVIAWICGNERVEELTSLNRSLMATIDYYKDREKNLLSK